MDPVNDNRLYRKSFDVEMNMNKKSGNTNFSASLNIKQKFSQGVISALVIAAGILGIVSITNTNSNLDLHFSPVCAPGNTPYVLDWSSLSWTDGNLSNTYSNVDGSGVAFTFNYSGSTSKFGYIGSGNTPNIQDFFPSEAVDALSNYVTTGFASGDSIKLSIDISPPIPANLAFELYHVNGSSFSGDKLKIYAESVSGGTKVYPTFASNGSSSWEDEGNGVVDATGGSIDSNNAYVGVNFNSATLIDKLVLVWKECDICGGNMHGFGMGNIEFCMSVNDTDGDNILDAVDLDDDNDGIPDIEEICGISTQSATGDITVEVQLDGYADIDNISWTLKNSAGTTVLSGGSYGNADNNTLVSETFSSAPEGEYTFEILDDWGDGLCCANQGYYQLKLDGTIVAGPVQGNFGSSSTSKVTISSRSMDCVGGDPSWDSDGDGIINYKDADFCVLNAAGVCSSLDKDGDGVPDYLDLDADNDGIPDIVEAGGADDDGDGRVDNASDSDNDGLATVFETAEGTTSSLLDTNGDGVNNIFGDFDMDNIPNWLDLDSDDDGIVDVVESGGDDTDQNGQIDNFTTDIDADGYADGVDGDVGNDGIVENTAQALVVTSSDTNNDGKPDNGYPQANMDATGKPNFLDIDADDDGIVDNTEGQATASYQTPSDIDSDADGIDNTYDDQDALFGGIGIIPVNTDLTDEPDYLDTDSDADLQADNLEGHDSNGDNAPDSSSPAHTGISTGLDIDGDGLDDGYDNNTLSCDPTNSGIAPTNHPHADGGSDQDWRAQTLLPVEWVSFQATWEKRNGLLTWETALELNASHFIVERALSKQTDYQAIGKVESAGNTTEVSSYKYVDTGLQDIGKGEKIFYRLKQMDMDGQFEYSTVVELLSAGQAISMKVYPNPATDFVSIEVNNGQGDKYLKIISTDGKVLEQRKMSQDEKSLRLSVDTWAKGVYIVHIEDDAGVQNVKLVVK